MTEKTMQTTAKKTNLAALKRESVTTCELKDPHSGEPLGIFIHGHPKASRAYLAINMKHNPPTKQKLFTGKQSYMEFAPVDPDRQLRIDAEAVTAIRDADGADIEGISIDGEFLFNLFKNPDYEYMGIQWQTHLSEEKND